MPMVGDARLASRASPEYSGGMRNDQKIVVLHGFEPEEALAAMRALKAALPSAGDAAFATTTETNLEWRLKDLVEHVSEEHRQYKEMSKPRKA
jgi:hypothetical protein